MKISSFIIMMILVTGIVTVLTLAISQIAVEYNVTFDNESNETLQNLSQLSSLIEDAEDIQESGEGSLSPETGITDIIGGYFKSGFQVLKISLRSLTTFWTMTDASTKVSASVLGPTAVIFKAMLIAIIIIAVFIGIFVSGIMKWKV